MINNQREKYSFLFNGILADDSSQEEVFERVCHASLADFMSGINATVFAYGQTGSGKTFTITGGPERYAGAQFFRGIQQVPVKMLAPFENDFGDY